MRLIDGDSLIERMKNTWDMQELYLPVHFMDLVEDEPTVGKWISVKNRLPEEKVNPITQDFTEVICFCDFGGIPRRTDIRTYKFGKRCWAEGGHFWHDGQVMDGVITHWMPLPEPPEEETSDKA